MIFAINPISNTENSISSVTKNTQTLLSKYKQSQSAARVASVVVYQSLAYLTDSYGNGISLSSLENLKQTMSNENLESSSAFELVDSMIDDFDDFSSNGEVITETDFMSIVTFADAQDVISSSSYEDLNSVLKEIGSGISSSIAAQYGKNTALTLAFMNFMNSLSEENLDSLLNSTSSTNSSNSVYAGYNTNESDKLSTNSTYATSQNVYKSTSYATNPIQDYRTVTPAQLKSPINISV